MAAEWSWIGDSAEMIDIHCHLLPGIDDGPATLEDSLQLARALVADGIDHVVCTPHVFPGRWENRCSTIRKGFDDLVGHLAMAGIDLSLSWAGEIRLAPEVLGLLAKDELPLLGERSGTGTTVLLEMPDGQVPVGTERFVARLLQSGIRPVIAHPERNRGVMNIPARIEPLVDMGCHLQLTAASVTGHFGPRAQQTARWLIEQGWVSAVASDSHNLGGRRPRMREAKEWLTKHYGSNVARNLVLMGPAALCRRVSALPLPVSTLRWQPPGDPPQRGDIAA
jgi:protein-tyrosine phosphatase